MRQKRIGILTYFWSDNSGTFLQAYTLQQVLQKAFPGASVEIIDYRVLERPWRPNRQRITVDQWLRDFRRHRKYRASRRQHLRLSSRRQVTRDRARAAEFIQQLGYDAIFVGSDTILELQHYNGGVGVYWLPPSVDCVKIMIAASCRSESYDRLSDSQRNLLRESVEGFALKGVRDVSTKTLLTRLLGAEDHLELTPDPTVCFDIDHEGARAYLEKRKLPRDKPIAAFTLRNEIRWRSDLARLLQQKGYVVASLQPAPHADYILNDVTPFEWAGLFRSFEVVVTTSFHDSLFCLKNGVPFVSVVPDRSYISDMNSSKYHHLLDTVGSADNVIADHGAVTAADVFEKLMRARDNFDAEGIARRLEEQRHAFGEFVNKAKRLCEA